MNDETHRTDRRPDESPTVVTSFEEFRQTAESAPEGARVPVEVRIEVPDPFLAYRRARDESGGVYFETTGGESGWGYFGVSPVEWLEVEPDGVRDVADETRGGDQRTTSFDALEGLLDGETLARGHCDVPYPCGAFGWLSYDVARELEALPDTTADDRGLPRLQFGVYDLVAAWEEPWDESATLRITACPRVEGDDSLRVIYDRAKNRALDLADEATTGDSSVGDPPADGDTAEFTSQCGREEYADRVRKVKEYVRDGDTFQANISQRLVGPAIVHSVEVFEALREVNPAPYSGLLEFPGVDLVSTSPELLLDADGRDLLTEPIAGTRPRGATPDEDAELREALLDSEKEHAEHAMLVDLERNDLGKVAEYGSVEVTDYRRIDTYSEVMHTVSAVEGRLRDDESIVDAIAGMFPGGTITGAPKPRTMEIIDEVEDYRRGPYTGSIGVLGFDRKATMNMTIRTLTRHEDRFYLRVGAGIVHDSVPDAEFIETLDKGRALVNAIDTALDTGRELTTADWPTRDDVGER
ncbi:anthranilate synthase component I family protein [Halorussus lipolyticus]|uniref:anthranilate synthase component I family protein n=1 Tax=Halorussus lipolyticus TaxID=3034024 RepID=UPI0023E8AE22|nr:anthranilate synthase component I family protein [Halorussus sp. DT80]